MEQGKLFYEGKSVRDIHDVMRSNGELMEGGKFKGAMRKFTVDDGGEVDINILRDFVAARYILMKNQLSIAQYDWLIRLVEKDLAHTQKCHAQEPNRVLLYASPTWRN